MQYTYNLEENNRGLLQLFDIAGNFISEYKLQEGSENTLVITENQLQNGIYFVKAIINEMVIDKKKLIIIK